MEKYAGGGGGSLFGCLRSLTTEIAKGAEKEKMSFKNKKWLFVFSISSVNAVFSAVNFSFRQPR